MPLGRNRRIDRRLIHPSAWKRNSPNSRCTIVHSPCPIRYFRASHGTVAHRRQHWMLGRWIKMQRGELIANSSGRNETWTARGRNGTLLLGREYGPRGAGATEQAPSVALPYVTPRMGDGASKQDRAPHQRSRPFRFSWCSSPSSG